MTLNYNFQDTRSHVKDGPYDSPPFSLLVSSSLNSSARAGRKAWDALARGFAFLSAALPRLRKGALIWKQVPEKAYKYGKGAGEVSFEKNFKYHLFSW